MSALAYIKTIDQLKKDYAVVEMKGDDAHVSIKKGDLRKKVYRFVQANGAEQGFYVLSRHSVRA